MEYYKGGNRRMRTFKYYQHRKVLTPENEIGDGDYIVGGGTMTIRLSNGLLSDVICQNRSILSAIETIDLSHIEHWRNGVLHCDNGAAVIDTREGYEEYWLNGKEVNKEEVVNENANTITE